MRKKREERKASQQHPLWHHSGGLQKMKLLRVAESRCSLYLTDSLILISDVFLN